MTTPKTPANLELATIDLGNVEREELTPLWSDRIFLGKLSILCGHAAAGKSWLALAIAAAHSRGELLPDHHADALQGHSLILNFEDSAGDILRPRAEALKADLSRLHIVRGLRQKGGGDRIEPGFGEKDLPTLDSFLESHPEIRFVNLDPITAVFRAGAKLARDNAVRGVLQPLADIAQKHRVAILANAHLRKAAEASTILHQLAHSIAFGALPRTILLAAEHENGQRSISVLKNSYGLPPPPVGFSITDNGFEWNGVEANRGKYATPPRTLSAAATWLQRALANGPRDAAELLKLCEAAGLSSFQLDRAKTRLGIKPEKAGFKSGWIWALPSQSSQPSEQDSATEDGEHFSAANSTTEDGEGREERGRCECGDILENCANGGSNWHRHWLRLERPKP